MSEAQILKARCPGCNTPVKVKTRSLEKVVACPSCGASIRMSATASPRPKEADLPEADLWRDPPRSPSFALPLAIVAGACAAVLVVGIGAFATSGPGRNGTGKGPDVVRGQGPKESAGTRPADSATDAGAKEKEKDGRPPAEKEKSVAKELSGDQDKSVAKEKSGQPPRADAAAAAKARMDRAALRVSSLERQRRDWLLANSGRLAASGLKKIVWPNERLLQQARQEYEMARNEYQRSK